MDHKAYRARISSLHSDMCAITARIHATMTELGDDPATAEWSLLYNVASAVSMATCHMYDAVLRDPQPSALTDDARGADPFAGVNMVCTVCRGPVNGHYSLANQQWYWTHADAADAEDCTARTPVKAMVAAGNENVEPF